MIIDIILEISRFVLVFQVADTRDSALEILRSESVAGVGQQGVKADGSATGGTAV